jgi:Protein of unknown function (DUF3383)
MGNLSDHIVLNIVADSAGVARAGFGVPLILSANAGWTERVRSYSDIASVLSDFASGTPEYLTANAIFSQSPRPAKIKIGRSALKPTLRYLITPVAVNSTVYSVAVSGPGITASTASYTSDGSATAAEISAGLTTAINAVVGNNYLAADLTGSLTVTADAPGNWFALEFDPLLLTVKQNHADPGVATDLAAIALEDGDWYCLLTNYNSSAYVDGAATWVESNGRIYTAHVNDSEAISTVVGNGDTLDMLHTNTYGRTAGFWHISNSKHLAGRSAGKRLPLEPGSNTWKFAQLGGISTSNLTGTHRGNLTARKANFFENVAGKSFLSEGTMADGTFIDDQIGLDWLDDDLRKSVLEVLLASPKTPYTDEGISRIEAAVKASLTRAERRGIITEGWGVTVPKAADVSLGDKAARILRNVNFTATLAGAIHGVNAINGVISV